MSSTVKRITQLAVVVALVVAAVVAWRLIERQGVEFEATFDSTVGLYPGSDVQMLGVPVGVVTAIEPEGDEVRVSMRLDRGQEAAADTAAVIVAPTLVSDRFVQLTEPYDGGPKLEAGTVIEETAVPVEIDELYESLEDIGSQLGPNGANEDGALSDLLTVLAQNLEGNGADINQMIHEFGKATGTLANSDDDLFATIANFKEFNDMLVANDRTLAQANRQLATVADYLAEDRQDMQAAIANLGQALGILDEFIRDNRGNLQTSVENLIGPTQVLVNQKNALEETVRTIPLVLQNFLNAYEPGSNTLHGRGNLNELTVWSGNGLAAATSQDAPLTLFGGLEENQ
ncbi:MCE family protein [Aeromicrobium phragmitis]|uniref:MCE family protein n=1 Tax=Aeromicrobium phragmitis TaxID=2478914 RepID=A0A3L8PIE0_9ACTN|nr:MCE family protein [Aeromicrobium phragmitis]RLV55021.1 MCE family protein [Aeromicrobium phragmitis]